MIAPTKHLPVDRSLLAVGATLLERLRRPISASRLWEAVRGSEEVVSYDLFTLTLAMLFGVGAIELDEGVLRRVSS